MPIALYMMFKGLPATEDEIYEVQGDWIFNICCYLQVLRLVNMLQVTNAFRKLMNKLGSIFYLKRYMFLNLLEWTLTAIKFLISLHYFACFWILLTYQQQYEEEVFVEEVRFKRYLESMYLMTTTITTVGYGDYKGRYDDESEKWTYQMLYLYFVTLFGIILFSLVTREIFNYNSLMTVQMIIKRKLREIEDFFDLLQRKIKMKRRKGQFYVEETIETTRQIYLDLLKDCKGSVQEFVKRSTMYYFAKNRFYQELPSTLQKKLVNEVLQKQLNSFHYFIEDFEGRNCAPTSFIVELVTKLDSQMYRHGETVVQKGQCMNDLILIRKGECNLFGYVDSVEERGLQTKVLIVKLPRNSWYGDF